MVKQKHLVDLETGSHWIDTEGIFCSKFHVPMDGSEINTEVFQKHLQSLSGAMSNKRYLFLTDLTNFQNGELSSFLEWMGPHSFKSNRIAEAFVVESFADAVFLKQHIRLKNLMYPAMVFQSMSQAKEVLNQISTTVSN